MFICSSFQISHQRRAAHFLTEILYFALTSENLHDLRRKTPLSFCVTISYKLQKGMKTLKKQDKSFNQNSVVAHESIDFTRALLYVFYLYVI